MLDFLFGEGQYGLRFLFAFVVVLGLIGLTAWLVRRFGSERLGAGTARGRQPRLAVIDAATVDGRRRLILIRRDNVEHLLMIGGPTDVVIEPNIVRTAIPREAAPQRPPAAATDPLPRAVPLGEGSLWPLQPEPAPIPSPAPRPQRQAPPVVEEPMQWHAEPEAPPAPPPPIPPRQPRPVVDPLAGLAAELSRQPPINNPPPRAPREREPAREREPVREPARSPQPTAAADGQFASSADANLAEMAQRLEAALRRTPKTDAPPRDPKLKVPPPPPAPQPEPQPPLLTQPEPMAPAEPEPMAAPAAVDVKPPRGEAKPAREGKSAPPKSSLYDSLEQEMASLLGRPNKT